MCPTEAMRKLEQQTSEILDVMCDRVSGVVDNDFDKIDTDHIQMPYDNDNETTTGNMKYEQNMTDELKDTDINDTVPHERDDSMMTKVK